MTETTTHPTPGEFEHRHTTCATCGEDGLHRKRYKSGDPWMHGEYTTVVDGQGVDHRHWHSRHGTDRDVELGEGAEAKGNGRAPNNAPPAPIWNTPPNARSPELERLAEALADAADHQKPLPFARAISPGIDTVELQRDLAVRVDECMKLRDRVRELEAECEDARKKLVAIWSIADGSKEP